MKTALIHSPLILLSVQLAAVIVLAWRLWPGRRRMPPVVPRPEGDPGSTVTVVIPTRNEARRLRACLDGIGLQGAPLLEVIVVDGASTDGTQALVREFAARDARIRLMDEPRRPSDAVGRPWAIAAGCDAARGEWVMVVDADTIPKRGMIAGAVRAARDLSLDAVSFAPRIIAPSTGARLLQPAFLTTLVYRFGATGVEAPAPHRVMANGQAQLFRRAVLMREGGYRVAASSFCDDVRIARHLATRGARVGFLDGRDLLEVLMYPTGPETWRAWPPSLNLRDATSVPARWLDALFLLLVQGIPLPMLAVLLAVRGSGVVWSALLLCNAGLIAIRIAIATATAPNFRERGLAYWCSPLADVAACLRVTETILRPSREWRGRAAPQVAT
jgi:dolichol-phosphate mannosyltransferase